MLNKHFGYLTLKACLQAVLIILFLTGNVLAQANTPPGFGGVGKVTTNLGFVGRSVALQPDGKIVVAGGGGGNDFTLTRYNANGSLDTSFNSTGSVTTDFGPSDIGYSVAIQPDGKIVVAGEGNSNFAVARYNTNGNLDASFGGTGKVTTDFELFDNNVGTSVAVQPDGKIVVAGYSYDALSRYVFSVARYNTNGSLDTSFNGSGKVTTDFGSAITYGYSVAIQPGILPNDLKIVVAGQVDDDFALVRYNVNGSLDTSFGGTGKVITDFGSDHDTGYSVAIKSDGKIVMAGYSNTSSNLDDFSVARYNADGSLDTSFGGTGKVITDFGSDYDTGTSVAIQLDGKIVAAGHSYSSSYQRDFSVVRYNVDGSLDTSFNSNGKLTTDFAASDDWGYSIALQPDGKIVVAGFSGTGSDTHQALARYNADGSLDLSFGFTLRVAALNFTENSAPVALEPGLNVTDAELSALGPSGNYNGLSLTLSRQGGANPNDEFSSVSPLSPLTAGSTLISGTTAIGMVEQNSAGTLRLSFNSNATQPLLNQAVKAIAYRNTSHTPPASVQLDWVFDDGNTGAQGTGGAMTGTATTTVTITPFNDPPTGTNATLTVPTNGTHTFSLVEFGFNDPEDGTVLTGVRIDSLPTQGTLLYDNGTIGGSLTLSAANILGGLFKYQPSAGGSGTGYASFSFSVQDSGGKYSTSPNTNTFNVGSYNNGSLGFASSNVNVTEGAAGTVQLLVQRTGDTDGLVSVAYATANGTAFAPGDYLAQSGSLVWPAGDGSARTIVVQLIDDNLPDEGTETFSVNLSNPTGGASLGTSTSTVNIQDNELRGAFEFAAVASTVRENAGNAVVIVNRVNGLWGNASVNYSTANGTALSGSDYTATSGTLNWAHGDGTSRTITIPIINDGIRENVERFTVTLSGAVGANLGSPATHTVSIRDTKGGLSPGSVDSDDGLTSAILTPPR